MIFRIFPRLLSDVIFSVTKAEKENRHKSKKLRNHCQKLKIESSGGFDRISKCSKQLTSSRPDGRKRPALGAVPGDALRPATYPFGKTCSNLLSFSAGHHRGRRRAVQVLPGVLQLAAGRRPLRLLRELRRTSCRRRRPEWRRWRRGEHGHGGGRREEGARGQGDLRRRRGLGLRLGGRGPGILRWGKHIEWSAGEKDTC